MKQKHVVIVGGGASGLTAAISAARTSPSARITVLEGLDRAGKKILATGNGRCNLTNTSLITSRYHTRYFNELEKLLKEMPAEKTVDFFRSIGLLCAEEEMGRVYPNSRQASAVLDVLLNEIRRDKIEIICGARVTAAAKEGRVFRVVTESGQTFYADALILSTGGRAAPKQGTDGSGYSLARHFGHSIEYIYPCLVPVRCAETVLKGLKGVRAHGRATLLCNGKTIGSESGEIQFTDYGLSGIPIFQLSCLLDQKSSNVEILVDLLPAWSESQLLKELKKQASLSSGDRLEQFLPGFIHKKLLHAIMKECNLSPLSRSVNSVGNVEFTRLAKHIKAWKFHVTGNQGWEYAQVTGGGVALDEIDDGFQSLRCPGLFLSGEILDVVGDCGGYNLHWAWCSGLIAGKSAANHVGC